MKLKKNNILYYSLILIFVSLWNLQIQVVALILFGIIILLFSKSKLTIDLRGGFYLGLIFLSLIQILLIYKENYGINYILNTLIATLIWFIAFLVYLISKTIIKNLNYSKIEQLLTIFLTLDLLMIVIQYVKAGIKTNSLLPFASHVSSYGMSTGDHLVGLFVNSSVNMIILSFFTIYYVYKKDKKVILALIAMLFTTYMSGLLIFVTVISIVVFFSFGLKTKFKVIGISLVLFFTLQILSPNNIKYVKQILTEKINSKTDPPRKIISLKQTLDYWTDSAKNFIFGGGAGKFSSRTAFLTGGEYVSWYPKSFIFRTKDFEKNNFSLWNHKILSIPFKDGTSNQPFSFYNQIIGEFGTIGLMLFFVYLFYIIKRWHKLSFGKLLIFLLLPYFLLDYWFDYFSVILFFELFINLDLKRYEENLQ